jgi:hypothetical protein
MRAIIAAGLMLGTLVATPAFADDTKGGPTFPIPAAQFKQRVDARQAKAQKHMEERAAKLPANEAQALRATFAAATAKVNAEVAKAIADGTVTKEEAQAVRAASPHRGGGHHCEGKDKKS